MRMMPTTSQHRMCRNCKRSNASNKMLHRLWTGVKNGPLHTIISIHRLIGQVNWRRNNGCPL
jgi:hypothetical protein